MNRHLATEPYCTLNQGLISSVDTCSWNQGNTAGSYSILFILNLHLYLLLLFCATFGTSVNQIRNDIIESTIYKRHLSTISLLPSTVPFSRTIIKVQFIRCYLRVVLYYRYSCNLLGKYVIGNPAANHWMDMPEWQ